MKKIHIYHHVVKAIFCVSLATLALSGCIKEDNSDCPQWRGRALKVVLAPGVEAGETGGGNVQNVMLYVFDAAGLLLETRVTETERVEYLDHRGTLTAVAIAGVKGNETVTDLTPGSSFLDQGLVSLLRDEAGFPGDDVYREPDDLLWGEIALSDDNSSLTAELPIDRVTAGVLIHVEGLKEYLGVPTATDSDFRIELGAPHNTLNFHGEPLPQTGATDRVYYNFTGSFLISLGQEYYAAPVQNAFDTHAEFKRILASQQGSPVRVEIYYRGTMITALPIEMDNMGQPLLVKNRLLNILNISFTGSITVTVERTTWGERVEIDKEYGY